MRGIYLPIIRKPEFCHKRCITLLYTSCKSGMGHFTALIGSQREDILSPHVNADIASFSKSGNGFFVCDSSLVSLVDNTGTLLPLRYCNTKLSLKLTNGLFLKVL
jgi:hypothetical protein